MSLSAGGWRPARGNCEGWRDGSARPRGRGGGGGRPARRPGGARLHLAQAQSNQGARGRKRDFPDAERLVKRLVADELTLSFVPDPEQRLWRTVVRRKQQV